MDHTRLDKALYTLKWCGRYQLTQFGLIIFSVLPASHIILSYIFIGYDGPHTCTNVNNVSYLLPKIPIDENTTVTYGSCDIIISTNVSSEVLQEEKTCLAGNTYTENKQTSIVSEWDLVCEKASMAELTQTLFVLGQATGAFLCSSISDRYGRRITYTVSIMAVMICGIVLSFAPNFTVFATFRFLVGIFQQGTDLTIATMILEAVPTEKRFKVAGIGSCLWGTSLMLLAPIAYLLRDVSWRYLQLTIALMALYSLILPFKLDETLRWLIANGKTKEVKKILKKAAKMNNVPVEKVMQVFSEEEQVNGNDLKKPLLESENIGTLVLNVRELPETSEKEKLHLELELGEQHVTFDGFTGGKDPPARGKTLDVQKYTVLDILKSRLILMNAAIVWYCWVVDSLVYYGIYMTSSTLASNRYLNYFLNSAVEVPGSLLMYFTLERFGRRRISLVFHSTAGVSLLIAVLLKTFASNSSVAMIFSTVFSLVGKMTITAAFGTLFIYTPELFPTNLRNAGLGAASSISRLGGMLAPYARILEQHVAWAPGAVFSGICILAGFLIQFLPETRGHELPQTMEEIREWYKANVQISKKKSKQ